MDDLLTIHADRVKKAHEEHEAALKNIWATFETNMMKSAAELRARNAAAMTAMAEAQSEAQKNLEAVCKWAIEKLNAAFADDVAEVTLSGAGMIAEIESRTEKASRFLATGAAPIEPTSSERERQRTEADAPPTAPEQAAEIEPQEPAPSQDNPLDVA